MRALSRSVSLVFALAIVTVSAGSAWARPNPCSGNRSWDSDLRRCVARPCKTDHDPRCKRYGQPSEAKHGADCPSGQAMRGGKCLPICAIGIVNSCK